MNYIETIKKDLDKEMQFYCIQFLKRKKDGSKTWIDENGIFKFNNIELLTPRYLNYGEFDSKSQILTIASTQNININFKIKVDFNFVEVEIFWPQFKEYRTQYLIKNYPEIKTI